MLQKRYKKTLTLAGARGKRLRGTTLILSTPHGINLYEYHYVVLLAVTWLHGMV
jgi:hypothetical protein